MYYNKYLKYKNKYNYLINQLGGLENNYIFRIDNEFNIQNGIIMVGKLYLNGQIKANSEIKYKFIDNSRVKIYVDHEFENLNNIHFEGEGMLSNINNNNGRLNFSLQKVILKSCGQYMSTLEVLENGTINVSMIQQSPQQIYQPQASPQEYTPYTQAPQGYTPQAPQAPQGYTQAPQGYTPAPQAPQVYQQPQQQNSFMGSLTSGLGTGMGLGLGMGMVNSMFDSDSDSE